MPARQISNFMPSSQRMPPLHSGLAIPAAFILSAVSLNSAQVVGGFVILALSIARVDMNNVLVR